MTSVAYNNVGMPLMSVGRSPAEHQWRTQLWYTTDVNDNCGVPVPWYATDEEQEVSGQVREIICGVPRCWYATDVGDICGVPKLGYATDSFPQSCCQMGNTSVAYQYLVRH